VRIRYSEEPVGALETGGGIVKALPMLGKSPFLVINGDIYTDFPFESLKGVLKQGNLAHLVMVGNPPHHPGGDFCLSADGVLHAEGKPCLTYSGIGIHHPEFFRGCLPGQFPMLPWWRKAMREGKVSGQFHSGQWNDVGTLAILHEIERA
jgi:MurNAc alpha-1-phosphate uridylyltransferase